MKQHFKTLALVSLVVLTSCSEDETSSEDNGNDQAIEEMEQTPLGANDIADNVVIAGATKNDGAPPTPNEAISLDVSSSSTTAFLGEGFEVEIESDADIVGAYLQFKSNDGSISDSYYDVDLNSNTSNKTSKNFRFSKKHLKSTLKQEDDTTLDVDFNSNIEPGTFCYVICVYDGEGNISAPEEVCVTVEAWGGNSEAVGKWNFITHTNEFEPEIIFEPNVENCSLEESPRFCDIEVPLELLVKWNRCQTMEYFEIVMNENGSYHERHKEIGSRTITEIAGPEGSEEITLEEWQETCDLNINSESLTTYEGSGKWAYIEESDSFVFIEYEYAEVYVYNDDEETYGETNEPGEGYPWYGSGNDNGEVEIVNGKMIISGFESTTTVFEK